MLRGLSCTSSQNLPTPEKKITSKKTTLLLCICHKRLLTWFFFTPRMKFWSSWRSESCPLVFLFRGIIRIKVSSNIRIIQKLHLLKDMTVTHLCSHIHCDVRHPHDPRVGLSLSRWIRLWCSRWGKKPFSVETCLRPSSPQVHYSSDQCGLQSLLWRTLSDVTVYTVRCEIFHLFAGFFFFF